MRAREGLPQLSDATFITDGGMETTLIFHAGRAGFPRVRLRRPVDTLERSAGALPRY